MPWLILLSLYIAIFSANSKAQEPPIEQLLNIEIAAYQLSSAFSAYVLFTGLPKYSEELDTIIEATSPILSSAKSVYPDIAEKWQGSLDYIERSKELVYSPDDHRLIIGFFTYQNGLYDSIEQHKQVLAQASTNSAPHHSMEEYLYIRASFERAIAQYIAFSASSAGFVVSDISIEDNVKAFSANIESITNKGAAYNRINTKWRFIKSNMLKNPGQTSPFITMRTAVDIRKLLEQIYTNELMSDSDF